MKRENYALDNDLLFSIKFYITALSFIKFEMVPYPYEYA